MIYESNLALLVPAILVITIWWSAVIIFDIPHFILPAPDRVAGVLFDRAGFISVHATTTALEIVCGLLLGSLSRVHSRLSDRRFKATAINHYARFNHQPSSPSVRYRSNLDALAWLRIRI